MRWFRKQVQSDPGRSEALLSEVRQRFGGHVPVAYADQARAAAALLTGDDGLLAAAGVLREFADAAYAEMYAQAAELHRRTGRGFAPDRANYRPFWIELGAGLRWTLFALPGGLHPYAQVAAAATVTGAEARRVVRVTAAGPVLAAVFEILDLTIAGWEYGRVRIDTDAAGLAAQLITTARELRDAMGDPPPLPDPVRELMRRNNTVHVLDPAADRVAGGFNPGKTMRENLLI